LFSFFSPFSLFNYRKSILWEKEKRPKGRKIKKTQETEAQQKSSAHSGIHLPPFAQGICNMNRPAGLPTGEIDAATYRFTVTAMAVATDLHRLSLLGSQGKIPLGRLHYIINNVNCQ
jgi:hypothetical protein